MSSSNNMNIAAVCVAGATILVYCLWKQRCKPKEAKDALNYMNINVVSSEQSCNRVVAELRNKCKVHSGALGFDCEWINGPGFRSPVALLQLSSHDGYCGLFRLNLMHDVPKSLKDLLEDENIYKIGVVPSDDAKRLREDYGVLVRSTLDVRHVALHVGENPGGLANLARNILNIILDKDWRVSCSDWEAASLSERQLIYAAADAHIAIKMFVKLINDYGYKLYKDQLPWWTWDRRLLIWVPNCYPFATQKYGIYNYVPYFWVGYVDVPYKSAYNLQSNGVHKIREKQVEKKMLRKNKTANMMRKSPLYHNCYLQAPDGEVLCTCDYKKAQWYIDKGLAVKVCEEPMSVRLKFEPSGRAVGDVGKYYQSAKENRCVVCGRYDSYIRKNVVPREYRKVFPEIMKEHSSHDVVLLCAQCHKMSNVRDQAVRRRLAVDCDAPLSAHGDNQKYFEEVDARKIRSAARALLYQSKKNNTLPDARRLELERQLMLYYPQHQESGVTGALLEEAANIPVMVENSEYESHGVKVVDHYLQHAGLLKLEELWRQHFLDAMRPQHMPPLWSIRHNEERLIAKLNEGRLTKEDPILNGVGLSLTSHADSN